MRNVIFLFDAVAQTRLGTVGIRLVGGSVTEVFLFRQMSSCCHPLSRSRRTLRAGKAATRALRPAAVWRSKNVCCAIKGVISPR
jgi:hypothetical protein